jgi:hypothetical protein
MTSTVFQERNILKLYPIQTYDSSEIVFYRYKVVINMCHKEGRWDTELDGNSRRHLMQASTTVDSRYYDAAGIFRKMYQYSQTINIYHIDLRFVLFS